MTASYASQAAHYAELAEHLAVALVTGNVAADLVSQARADLAGYSRAAEILRGVDALQRFRAGELVASWPARAPWAGF